MPTTNPFDDDIDQQFRSNDESYIHPYSDDDDVYPYSSDDDYDDEGLVETDNEYTHNSNQEKKSSEQVESSWQFLGDLPYRKVTLYEHVRWGEKPNVDNENIRKKNGGGLEHPNDVFAQQQHNHQEKQYGLACLPSRKTMSQQSNINNLSTFEYEDYIRSTTKTLIASCPNGGPIATVTVPSTTTTSLGKNVTSASIRTMTNSGQLISKIDFPPSSSPSTSSSDVTNEVSTSRSAKMRRKWFDKQRNKNQNKLYTPSDIFSIGFTGRCILVVILRDSLCLTYTLSGKPVLDPFYIFHQQQQTFGSGSKSIQGSAATMVEVCDACIYDGGVAVLRNDMTTAIVEILDSEDESDAFYRESSHVASRVVKSVDFNDGITVSIGANGGASSSTVSANTPMDDEHNTTSMYALITPLSTLSHAKSNFIHYTSMAVLPRIHTQSRHPEVFFGTSSNSVIICDSSSSGSIVDVYCQERFDAPIVKMKFAPNGRFLACFTHTTVTVISTNFETKVLDFNTQDGSNDVPNCMEWCGEDSVVLYWKNLGVLMVGPYGDWLRYPYENVEHLHLSPEMDCCRVVSDAGVEILQRVPPATSDMLRIGSIEPAAMLLDASDAFENGSPASDEAARAITKTGMLTEAIGVCIDAASREFDIKMQKRLLKAASYGMHFEYKDGAKSRGIMGGRVTKLPSGEQIAHPSSLAINFVKNTRRIRVLNALRDPSVGVAVTVTQYDSISDNGVIARLIAMKRPALATSLGNYLKLEEAIKAYARASRASAFVTVDAGHTDAETAETAMEILNAEVKSPLMNRGAYATVSLAAFKAGRPGVATLLLKLETNVTEKVPALTTIGLYSDAAAVAAEAK